MTVDGMDFLIQEPIPFDRKWYLHKFNHAGLRYEIGVCIQNGWIVWTNGPFAAGIFPDVTIFREALKEELMPGERIEVDSGYRGEPAFSGPNDDDNNAEWGYMKGKARARHENINGRIKQFRIFTNIYRNKREHHHLFFNAVVGIVQFDIKHGNGIYQIHYHICRNIVEFDEEEGEEGGNIQQAIV